MSKAAAGRIEIRDLGKTYMMDGARIEALKGVALDIDRGDSLAILGVSGAGKSTLLHILGPLDHPTEGTFLYDGVSIFDWSENKLAEFRNRKVGFVFQFHHLLPALTILENVMMPMLADKGRETPGMREAATELLRRVGLGERLKYKPDEVSGGQRQRAAIARALAMGPAVILADEPTGNLDTNSSAEVFTLLREINRSDGTAFVIVTHAADIAEQCDRIVEIVDGRLV